MKKLREIIFKTLVEKHGVEPHLLSRIESDEPVCIELLGGEEIFINMSDNDLQTYIEIPIKRKLVMLNKASKILEVLATDDQMYLNIQKDKILLACELKDVKVGIESELGKKFDLFNQVVNLLGK